jgi:hypothetical protein
MIIKINPDDDPRCPYEEVPHANRVDDRHITISISSYYCVSKCRYRGLLGIQDVQADCNHPDYLHSIKVMIPPEEIFPAIL